MHEVHGYYSTLRLKHEVHGYYSTKAKQEKSFVAHAWFHPNVGKFFRFSSLEIHRNHEIFLSHSFWYIIQKIHYSYSYSYLA